MIDNIHLDKDRIYKTDRPDLYVIKTKEDGCYFCDKNGKQLLEFGATPRYTSDNGVFLMDSNKCEYLIMENHIFKGDLLDD